MTSKPLAFQRKQKIISVGRNMKELEPLGAVGGMQNGATVRKNSMVIPRKTKNRTTICPAIPRLGVYAKELKGGTRSWSGPIRPGQQQTISSWSRTLCEVLLGARPFSVRLSWVTTQESRGLAQGPSFQQPGDPQRNELLLKLAGAPCKAQTPGLGNRDPMGPLDEKRPCWGWGGRPVKPQTSA